MSVRSFPASGRTLTLVNRSGKILGVLGLTMQPGAAKAVPMRKLLGHPSHMAELESLIRLGKVQAQVTSDVLSATDVASLDAPLSAEIWLARDVLTNPAAADLDGIKTSFTAPAAATNYSGTALNGVVGAGELDFARNITIKGTTGGGEALTSKSVVLTGVDLDGQVVQETIVTTVLGATATATDLGVHSFKKVTNIYVPADASPSPGVYEIGFGVKFGLSRPLIQGGLVKEFTNNAVPGTAATVVLSPTALPNGSVTFNTAPNGTNDYVVMYIAG